MYNTIRTISDSQATISSVPSVTCGREHACLSVCLCCSLWTVHHEHRVRLAGGARDHTPTPRYLIVTVTVTVTVLQHLSLLCVCTPRCDEQRGRRPVLPEHDDVAVARV